MTATIIKKACYKISSGESWKSIPVGAKIDIIYECPNNTVIVRYNGETYLIDKDTIKK